MTTRYETGACPACGEAGASVIADRDDIHREIEMLWSFHTKRLHGDTPPHRLHDRVAFSQDPPLRLVRCDACTLLYRNPRERGGTVLETYRGEEPDTAALATLFENQRQSYESQSRRLTRAFGRAGRGLEVGSYVGAFLHTARAHGWRFTGVDVNETANAFARSRGCAVRTGTIDDVDADATFDVVAFWNCFDQLPDPLNAARAAHARLRDGGMIAIRVPNGAFYERWRPRLDAALPPTRAVARTLLACSNLLGFPYRHGFSARSLALLLQRTGFGVVHVTGDALVPLADGCTRRWAAVEERLVRAVLSAAPAERAPWIEVYATRRPAAAADRNPQAESR